MRFVFEWTWDLGSVLHLDSMFFPLVSFVTGVVFRPGLRIVPHSHQSEFLCTWRYRWVPVNPKKQYQAKILQFRQISQKECRITLESDLRVISTGLSFYPWFTFVHIRINRDPPVVICLEKNFSLFFGGICCVGNRQSCVRNWVAANSHVSLSWVRDQCLRRNVVFKDVLQCKEHTSRSRDGTHRVWPDARDCPMSC